MFGNGHIESGDNKSFYRIGEVSRLTDTKPFVLRYWETEFPMLQPVKSPKGHRLYRHEDVETVLRIKRLLYDEGFTIAGARRHLREGHEDSEPRADTVGARPAEYGTTEHRTTEDRTMEDRATGNGTVELHADMEADAEIENHAPVQRGLGPVQTGLGMESWLETEDRPSRQSPIAPPDRSRPEPPAAINRQVLLDLRDSLQAFLTLLENE